MCTDHPNYTHIRMYLENCGSVAKLFKDHTFEGGSDFPRCAIRQFKIRTL